MLVQRGGIEEGRVWRREWYRVCTGLSRLSSERQGPACCWEGPSKAVVRPGGDRPAWSRRARGRRQKILKGPVQLSDSFSWRTLASVPDLAPWRMVAAVLYIHTQPPTVYIGRCLSGSESAEPLCSTREDSEGVPFANQLICKPLAVGGEFTVFQVVTGEALVASNVRVLEDGDREAGKALYMRLIGG